MYSEQDTLAGGLPHSDIHGSTPARGSPWLFAACHVLHRLLVPRHPPNALLSLETLAPGPKPRDPPCTETILRSRRPISPSVNPKNKPSTKKDCNCAKQKSLLLSTQQFASEHRTIAGCRNIRSDFTMVAPRDAPEPDSHLQRSAPPFGDTSGVAASNRNHQHRLLSLLRDTHPDNSNPIPDSRTVVEVIGLEPTTPCLQSRCSPS